MIYGFAMRFFSFTGYRNFILRFFFIGAILSTLLGCKINFDTDLYSSDLIALANHEDDQAISLPMKIEFQVASCDDLSTQNRIFSTYFSEYEFIGCDVSSEDFMSYVEAEVSTSATNSTEVSDLVGFQVDLSDDEEYVYVYVAINERSFEDLKEYVYQETFQELSLKDSIFSVSFINDSSDLNTWIQASFVDREPIVYQTEFLLKKREKISIVLSDVVKSHLEDNSWAPLLIMQNGE